LNQLIKKTVSLTIAVVFIAGCAGRAANPVAVNQYGDQVKSCKAIESELSFNDAEVTRLIRPVKKPAKMLPLG